MNIDHLDPHYTLGQSLFAFGLVIFLVGSGIWFFIGCDRYIKPYCVEGYSDPFYWIGALITGIGILLFAIGWLVLKEEKLDEPASSPEVTSSSP